MRDNYIIKATNQDNQEMFYAIDANPGHPEYWTHTLKEATKFSSKEDAINRIETSADLSKSRIRCDGKSYPPRLISEACNLTNERKTGFLTLEVCEISLKSVWTVEGIAQIVD